MRIYSEGIIANGNIHNLISIMSSHQSKEKHMACVFVLSVDCQFQNVYINKDGTERKQHQSRTFNNPRKSNKNV